MCLFKSRRQYRVTELTQTFNDHRYNKCSFVCCGNQYHGEGKPIVGFQRMMTQRGYMWTIYTNDHKQLFTFATDYANEPINTRKLSQWMREFLNNKKPG
jgi:hypothetical protein